MSTEKITDKNKAVKKLIAAGFDAGIEDSMVYVYYDDTHDNKCLLELVQKEIKNMGYGSSYGIKKRDKKNNAGTITTSHNDEDE